MDVDSEGLTSTLTKDSEDIEAMKRKYELKRKRLLEEEQRKQVDFDRK